MAGIVATINDTCEVDHIELYNVQITGSTTSTGGIIGHTGGSLKASNCKAEKLYITDKRAEMSGNKVETPGFGSVGGLAGDVTNSWSGYANVTNINISNSEFNSEGSNVAGIIGTLVAPNNEIINITIDNTKITNKNECSQQYRGGNIGGIIGYNYGNTSIKDSKVRNNSRLEIVQKEWQTPRHVGGVVGFSDGVLDNQIILENTNVEGLTISNGTYGNTGGLVGSTNFVVNDSGNITNQTQLIVINSNVMNCPSITGNFHTGGMLGFGKLVGTSGKVSGTTIIGNNTDANTGAIIGNALESSEIDELTAENCNITDKAGLIGTVGKLKQAVMLVAKGMIGDER